MPEPEIIEDTTETLSADLPGSMRFVPASATVRVQTPGQALPESGDAATIGTTELNTNAASSAGARTLSFAGATTVTAGRAYLLWPGGAVDAADAPDAFIVRFVDSGGTTLQLDEPLPEDVANGAGLVPWHVSHALTATETGDKGLGFAEWTITDSASVVHLFVQPFRVVLVQTSYLLSGSELTQMRPIMLTRQQPEDEHFTEALDASWAEVEQMLRSENMAPSRVRSQEMLKNVHADACVVHVLRQTERTDPQFLQTWEEVLRKSWQATLSGRTFWYDEVESLQGQTDEADPSRKGLDFSL